MNGGAVVVDAVSARGGGAVNANEKKGKAAKIRGVYGCSHRLLGLARGLVLSFGSCSAFLLFLRAAPSLLITAAARCSILSTSFFPVSESGPFLQPPKSKAQAHFHPLNNVEHINTNGINSQYI